MVGTKEKNDSDLPKGLSQALLTIGIDLERRLDKKFFQLEN